MDPDGSVEVRTVRGGQYAVGPSWISRVRRQSFLFYFRQPLVQFVKKLFTVKVLFIVLPTIVP